MSSSHLPGPRQARSDRNAAASGRDTDFQAESRFLRGLLRAFGGALIFALPMLMTMEMWQLGFYVDRLRLVVLVVLMLPVLTVLSYHAGFEETFDWREDVLDALAALAVGFITAAAVLAAIGIFQPRMSADEIIGKIIVQAVPASIGALLAQGQLGGRRPDDPDRAPRVTYGGEMFLAGIGAVFLALNLAPTGEMVLISFMMSEWHAITLVFASLAIMHVFVYTAGFHGQASPGDAAFWSVFLRYTVAGYALALIISLFVLWMFGRTDDIAFGQAVMAVIVLGFPAAIGAAAARLIL